MKNSISFLLLLCSGLLASAQWTDISTGKIDRVQLCAAIDANTCVATGNWGKIYRSLDGGMTFDSVQTIFDSDIFGQMEFVNDSVGYICGGSWFGLHRAFLARTTDQGQNWDSVASEIGGGYFMGVLCFIDQQTGFLASDEGVIHKTTDGGQNFSALPLDSSSALHIFDIDFPDAQTGYVTSFSAVTSTDFSYRIDKTTDQGLSWSAVWRDTLYGATPNTHRHVSSLHFFNANEGLVGGANGRLMRTTDGGLSWSLSILATDSTNLAQIQFTDAQHGYIATTHNYGGQPRPFFSTTDGGQTWQRQPYSFHPMSFVGAAGYAIDENYRLHATQTGGLHLAAPSSNLSLEVFPNPVGDKLTVRAPQSMQGSKLTITDSAGKVLRRTVLGANEQVIDIHGFAFGTYYLELDHPREGRMSKKFAVIGF